MTSDVPRGYLHVGTIVAAQGLGGEIRVYPTTDFIEERFAPGSKLLLGPDGKQLKIVASRPKPPFVILKAAGITGRTQAESLKGTMLYIRKEEAHSLEEDTYWFDDLVGCTVQTLEGEHLGEVVDVLLQSANDIYVVRREGESDLLIPAIKQVVKEVDVNNKLIKIWPMPGLLD